jgi:hypothetical protein
MSPLTIILDSDPETTVMWSPWEFRKATIKGDLLTVHWHHGDLLIESTDPQLVCDMIFSNDQKNVLVKGKLGIKSVKYTEKKKDKSSAARLRQTLKEFLRHDDE